MIDASILLYFSFDSSLSQSRSMEQAVPAVHLTFYRLVVVIRDFVYGEPKLQVIRDELDLCGYFAIISSEKMDAKKAISKNREQYDRLTAELEELHKKQKALQKEER